MAVKRVLGFVLAVAAVVYVGYALFADYTRVAESYAQPAASYHDPAPGDVIQIVMKVAGEQVLTQFQRAVTSMLQHTASPIHFHIITSQTFVSDVKIATEKVLRGASSSSQTSHEIIVIEAISGAAEATMAALRQASNTTGYYGNALFYVLPVMHQVIKNATHAIVLDTDVVVKGDVAELWSRLKHISSPQMIGLAYEQQPVYRHILIEHRARIPESKLGLPAREQGFPGFNSGVALLHLSRMRASIEYNAMMQDGAPLLQALAQQLLFKGHLGDQDLFTLLYIRHTEWFSVLPCHYNRQLCAWWYDFAGYDSLRGDYYPCEDASVLIYHGNCNSNLDKYVINA